MNYKIFALLGGLLFFQNEFSFASDQSYLLNSSDSLKDFINPKLTLGKKGSIYFYWGYNRSIYSKSNIHVSGPNYDFTLYKLKASDRPSPFSFDTYLNPGKLSIPQFNVRVGYYLSDEWSISVGYDHMKYVMEQNQLSKISGVISKEASLKYEGSYLNQYVIVTPDLLTFEHTDGLNVLTVDIEYGLHLFQFSKQKFSIKWNFGCGGIFVAPRSDLRVFGKGLNNDYHIAGYTFTAKAGPRINILKRYFFSVELRGGYISLPSVLVQNESPELADHNFSFLEYYFVGGAYIPLRKSVK